MTISLRFIKWKHCFLAIMPGFYSQFIQLCQNRPTHEYGRCTRTVISEQHTHLHGTAKLEYAQMIEWPRLSGFTAFLKVSLLLFRDQKHTSFERAHKNRYLLFCLSKFYYHRHK